MPRLVPNPQLLIDTLRRLVPHPVDTRPGPASPPDGPSTDERILDAALAAFTANGIKATTMTRIAGDAGISREWLYRRFPNRDAVVVAVTQREVGTFIDGLAVRAFASDDLDGAVTEAFVYAVEFLRDHALLQRVLRAEAGVLSPRLLESASPVVALAVGAVAGYLSALGDLTADEATIVAETIVRLVGSAVVAPVGAVDLHDTAQLRRYAAVVVPAVIAGARASTAEPPAPAPEHEGTP